MEQMTQDSIKRSIGKKAASLVENGMLVGLGTGSTAKHFIDELIDRTKEGLKITAVSSSIRSLEQAKAGGIPIVDMDQVTHIDLTVDGADEIDPQNRMIKGGGGALVREKILATASKKIIIIVDESKLVDVLGKFGLPLEILPFGLNSTLYHIQQLGYVGKIRTQDDGSKYITDNGNYIFDIHSPTSFADPEFDHDRLVRQAGVVDTGFFFNLPLKALVGFADGTMHFRD